MNEGFIQILPYAGVYIHGISLSDFLPCWNLSLAGQIMSSEFAAICDSNLAVRQTSIRNSKLSNLKTPQFAFGVVTPRAAQFVCTAAIIRAGGHVGIGVESTRWLPRDEMDRILRIGDMEIAFEEMRRAITPNAASRLCCLWVAEDTDIGQAHVRSMLGVDVFLLRVLIIAAIRVTKTDSRWFDAYAAEPRDEYIANYWNGVPYEVHVPTWEYLVEGVITVIDDAALAHVREHGAHRKLMAQPNHP
jgi:hypothetical protein